MRFISYFRFLGVVLALLILPALAAAQDSVKCESNDGNRQYCGSYNYDQVRFDRQISESSCTEGQTWGVDRDGLWVDRGCRAMFLVGGDNRRGGNQYGGGSAQNSVTCSSDDGNRQYCGNYNYDQVRLERQISGSPCTDGQTWGVDRNGLWVDRGCRAVFTIFTNQEAPDRHRDADHRDRDRGQDAGGAGISIWWEPDTRDTWPPRGEWHGGNWDAGGACFYKDSNFGGSFFCLRRGEQRESLGNYGDQISSMRVFGRARTMIYDDRNFSGARQRVSGDVGDLRQYRVAQKPGHTWNNRVSSIRVQ
ncbi:MAG: DUF3011 domain-containing protein [Candidatus Acidiferrum sp.]